MCKVQSVEMFISSTDATGTTGYLSYKIISLIDNSQNKTKKQTNKQTKYIYTHTSKWITVQSTNAKFLKKYLEYRRKSLSPRAR